jgi:hypothetical protein
MTNFFRLLKVAAVISFISVITEITPATAQPTLLSTNPTVIRVNFSIVLGYTGPIHAASVQFDVTAPSINFLVPSAGSAAVAAGKDVACGPLVITPGPPQTSTITCVVFGINQLEMGAGTVVNFYAIAVPDTKPEDMKLVLSNVLASSATGMVAPVTIAFPKPVAVVPTFVDDETPGGVINGTNTSFTLAHAPNPASSLYVFRNGLRLRSAVDYSITGTALVFLSPISTPQPGDVLLVSYRY